jgi:hypothetical protein
MTKLDLIKKLEETGVRISGTDETYQWVEIHFEVIDCILMQKIGKVVEDFFKVEGNYTHKLPKFIGRNGSVCLIFDVSLLK